jgi:putative transposase
LLKPHRSSIREHMKLTATVKLQPTEEQASFLRATLERANAACNTISDIAWNSHTFGQYKLHHACYRDLRACTGLSAQVLVRCIAKVVDAYKLDRCSKRTFRPTGAIAYDDRILRWLPNAVSIWTTGGRRTIPFVCGACAWALLASRKGESDLFVRDGQWFLAFTATVEEPPADWPDDFLGVDLGIVNLAATSDGQTFAGAALNGLRIRHERLRKRLQAKGTRGARRRLRKRSSKQRRFQRHSNHAISKRLVAVAKGTGRGIALEDLTGIRARTTAPKRQRSRHGNWGFAHLRHCLAYKARLSGVPVLLVDPRNTSRTCPACGCIDKANRVSQSRFLCRSCGFSGSADLVAAENIRRAAVNQPHCPDAGALPVAPGQSSRL